MQTITRIQNLLPGWAKKLGPYLALELLLPGGTLFALLLFTLERRTK